MRNIITLIALCAALSGCNAINGYASAGLNSGAADYAGAKSNAQKADDMKFALWADSACDLPLGALKRNNTGNTNAVAAALKACPVPNPATTLQTQDLGTSAPLSVGGALP